jgi:16S rRNA (cytosine967-C5)-methyltransferase
MTQEDAGPGTGARAAAHKALGETLRRKRPLDAALDDAVIGLSSRDAGFARAIANETMRRFGQLDALVRVFVPKAPPAHRAGPTLEILLAGACELIFLDVPAHAAVDGANRLASADPKAVHFKPLINASLRRIAREGPAIVETQDAPRLNTPDWLWTRWCEAYGQETTRAIAHVHAQTPPLDLAFACGYSFRERGEKALELPGGGARIERAGSIEALRGFAEGAFWVQDFAASLPVRLLGDVQGQRVIDLCAAPGGKTAQLCTLGADVVAVDRDEARLALVSENLGRLRLRANLVSADVRDYKPEQPAPCVLLDSPCSATGTIRRHPELPWIKSAADIASCADTAQELLDAAAGMVASGGKLVFAVCSLEPEEGPEQIEYFLRHHAEIRRVPIAAPEIFGLAECIDGAGDFRTLPCHFAEKGGMDGFYAARLERQL